MKGIFIPDITVEMFRNGCLEGIEALMAEGEVYDIEYDPKSAEPRKRGKWVRSFDGNEWYWYCSKCKKEWYEEDLWMGGNDFPNFCPNCGAKMDRGKKDE